MDRVFGSSTILAFVLLAGVVSCGSSGSGGADAAGGASAGGAGGIGAAGSGAAGSGAGGGAAGSSGGSLADAFVGTWTFDSGDLTPLNCAIAGSTLPSLALPGRTLVITKVDATHVTSAFGPSCDVTFAVSGTSGTAAAGQTCGVMLKSGVVSIAVSSWSLSLSNGALTTDMAGSVPLLAGCTVSGSGSLAKTAP